MMNFFNEQWMNSENPLEMYPQYLKYLEVTNLPLAAKNFAQEMVDLHDGKLTSINHIEKSLIIDIETPSNKGVSLQYYDAFLNEKDRHVLKRVGSDQHYSIAYDEFAEEAEDFIHRLNFFYANSLDGEIEIVFRGFSFTTTNL